MLHQTATHCELLAPCTVRTNRSRQGVKPQHEGQSANGWWSWPTLQSARHRHACPGLPQVLHVRCCDNPCNARHERGDYRGTETGGVNDKRRKEGATARGKGINREEGRKWRKDWNAVYSESSRMSMLAISTFRDRFRRIGMRPRDSRIGLSHSPAIVQITSIPAQSSSVHH